MSRLAEADFGPVTPNPTNFRVARLPTRSTATVPPTTESVKGDPLAHASCCPAPMQNARRVTHPSRQISKRGYNRNRVGSGPSGRFLTKNPSAFVAARKLQQAVTITIAQLEH